MHHRATKTYHEVVVRKLNIEPRSPSGSTSSSSATSDADRCIHNTSSECQKPVSNDALTIALAVVLPVVVICAVLGLFLYRNYRKDKKESMEHDPDFDENGEATALPDLPHPKYNMEDPFHNRNSVRYPQAIANAGSKNSFHNLHNKSSTSLAMSSIHGGVHSSDPYLDTFVLPYHHQTGSKASLDDYARHFGIQGFDGTPRSSTYGGRTRNSSISRQFPAPGAPSNISPQKSNLRTEVASTSNERSPVKRLGEKEYTNIPNHSALSVREGHDSARFTTASDIESVTNSDDSRTEKCSGGIRYENESSLEANNNNTAPTPFFEGVQGLPPIAALPYNSNARDTHTHPAPDVDSSPITDPYSQDPHHEERLTSSPFDDTHHDTTANTSNTLHSDDKEKLPYETTDDHIDGDFNFTSDNNTTHDQSQMNLTQDLVTVPLTKSRSPRISQFNLLKNDSDTEDYDNDNDGENQDFEGQILDEQQQEELKRMKSVYRVYFDGEAAHGQEQPDFEVEERSFRADPSHPVPQININSISHVDDRSRINRDLKMDTNYDKRMTTTSSIYTESPDYHNEQHYSHPQQEYNYDEQYHYYQQQQQQQQYQQQNSHLPPQDLPPLQRLRNASDIRKSTLQTYTDFQPRTANAPTQRQPFNPIDGWTSPKNSPGNQSQSTFTTANGSSHSILPPSTSSTSLSGSLASTPSATQLARNSVVMLNPVTEITKQRTFKPAGSLTNTLSPPTHPNSQFHNGSQHSFDAADGSLIPGNRKSDVRRMMNTNF